MAWLAGNLRRGASAFVARPNSSTRSGRQASAARGAGDRRRAGGAEVGNGVGNIGEEMLGRREDRERK
jgi:hypothetical protein